MIATVRRPRPLLTACAVGTLLLGLAACGTAEEGSATSAAPTTAGASASPAQTSVASDGGASAAPSPSTDGTSSPADGGEAAARPAVILAPVPGAQAEWSGEDYSVNLEGVATLLAGQLGAEGEASATCEAELSSASRQGVLCHGQSTAEGPASGETVWTAYPSSARESEAVVPVVLFVQGENLLDAQAVELITDPGSIITGVGQGTMFLTRTLSQAETEETVAAVLASENAFFPIGAAVANVSCEGAMDLQSMIPHHCTADIDGAPYEVSALPAQFLLSDGGLVLIYAPAS